MRDTLYAYGVKYGYGHNANGGDVVHVIEVLPG